MKEGLKVDLLSCSVQVKVALCHSGKDLELVVKGSASSNEGISKCDAVR